MILRFEYFKLQDDTSLDIEDEKQRADAEFYDYISTSYRHFLAGDDNQCEEIDNSKAAEFEERAVEVEGCNKRLHEVQTCSSNITAYL